MGRAHAEREPEGAVAAQAEGRLRESRELADCPIVCEFRDGTLTLRGRVPKYSLKQSARWCVQGIPGVEAIDNRIDVIPLPISGGPAHEPETAPGVDHLRLD
jgi:osmotically-inducible protein OsmY